MGGTKCDFFIDKNGYGVFEGTISTLYVEDFLQLDMLKARFLQLIRVK